MTTAPKEPREPKESRKNVVDFMSKKAQAAAAAVRTDFDRGDHVEIAERLVSVLKAQAPTVFADGQLWQYTEAAHIYQGVDASRLSQIVQGFAGMSVEGKNGPYPLRLKSTDIAGAIQLAQHRVTDVSFFIDAPKGLVFANGFVEVTAEQTIVHKHSPDHRARFAYSFPFDRNANPCGWLKALDEIFEGDTDAREKVMLLQEYIGTALLGLCTRYQKDLILVGDGSNGKKVIAQVAEAAMPPGSCCAIPPQEFGQEYRRAMLAGKLLNVVSELPETDILESEAFKDIVSGDSTTGREIRKAPFTFRAIAGHLFSTNRLPGTVDQTHGFWRRHIVVTHNRVFLEHEQDAELADRLIRDELPAIVPWFLAGAQRVQLLKRYTIPASHAAALSTWKQSADQVLAFVENKCEQLEPNAPEYQWEAADNLYQRYRTWAGDNGHKPMASNKFAERMRLLKLPVKHTKHGNIYPVTLRDRTGA